MSLETQKAESPNRTVPKTLFGYDVVRALGDGAGSAIYAVKDRRDGQLYALKHVIRHSQHDDRYIRQLENEFAVSRNFRHPALRRCVDLKLRRTLLRRIAEAGLVMELVDGLPLDQQKPCELPALIAYFADVARGLAALHYLLLVHCDLKPNNILTTSDGAVKLIDFGQACRAGTTKDRIQGTPDFIAPEQVRLRPVTVQTDVFNFGATLYWALSGQRIPTLFTVEKSRRDVVLECKFPSPRELNPAVPQPLSDLVMQCVRVDPLKRPADMAQILALLSA